MPDLKFKKVAVTQTNLITVCQPFSGTGESVYLLKRFTSNLKCHDVDLFYHWGNVQF